MSLYVSVLIYHKKKKKPKKKCWVNGWRNWDYYFVFILQIATHLYSKNGSSSIDIVFNIDFL